MLKTLDQSLKILKMFTKEKPSWGARELATKLELPQANVYRMLETFEKNRFLRKDQKTKQYALGVAAWELGIIVYDQLNLADLLRPTYQKLLDKTGESVFLTALDGNEGVTMDAVEPENKVKFSVSIGSRAPLYVGASYRSILAFLPEQNIENVLNGPLHSYTEITKNDKALLLKDLEQTKSRGWSISYGEYTPDVIAIAAPVFYENSIVGSVTLSGPNYRMSEEAVASHLPFVLDAAKETMDIMTSYRLDLRNYFTIPKEHFSKR
ncbi:IclR family transcriptional regulator [Aureibacillus halotolerans]|uniref:IclR family transcriptional regulator n=1 Tax=Aureibacillus halotolerans TaxID=1508390 RepID=A0A4R6TSE7_9BACI|nr:IclR family transcriptional regulator [Aureibacillus halotolerans]TDQ36540.1 IclR family transcriptional regulator [Aureibacillus halotolerans]